jgi:signal recognition particle receptor subunit beta
LKHCEKSDASGLPATARQGLKIVIVGGFAVGKTTMVRSVSEIRPLTTEERMTQAGVGVDEAPGVGGKTNTTIAFDFGRITINEREILYLFGAPGQPRFWFLWNRLFLGTLGAVVLLDSNRLDESFHSLDRLEHHGVPFIVARNKFGSPDHSLPDVRDALGLSSHIPLIDCDARQRQSSKTVLVTLLTYLYQYAGVRTP